MMILLVLFGGAISGGGLLREVTWAVVLFVVLTIFLVRPLIGWISLAGRDQPADEKVVISFFGIRGLSLLWHFFQRAEREAGSADRTSQLHDLRELIQQSGADGRQAGLRRWSTSFSFFPAWRL
jgi:hypothetical protein